MVNIREKKTGEQTYYYLEHSVRKGSKIIKKEKYLGKEIPKDIERIKRAFIIELYNKKWFNDFEMLSYQKDLSLQILLHWHKKLFEKTKLDMAGKIRNHQVGISLSKYTPPMPSELDFLIKDFFDWYNQNKSKLNSVELAAIVHLKLVTIHPFSDGNGRISRLMMNFVLHKYRYPMLDIPYTKRNSYYTALERSQIKKDDSPFLNWFFKRYIKDCESYSK